MDSSFLYVPAGAITTDNEIKFSLKGYSVISDQLKSSVEELESLRLQVNQLTASNSELTREMTGIMTARDHATRQALEANEQVQRVSDTNQELVDKLADRDTEVERLKQELKTHPAPPPVPVPDPKPVPVPNPAPELDKVLPEFATYLVDKAGSGTKRTATMRGHADKLEADGINEIVIFLNETEIEDGELPEHFAEKEIWFWSDTFRAVYLNCQRKTAESQKTKKPRDFWGETMNRIDEFLTLRGFVLDDVNAITPEQFEDVVVAIREYSSLSIVATFGAGTDLTGYMPVIRKYNVKVARQLFRHEFEEKPNLTTEERTEIVTTWLTQKDYLCDIVNLEYYKDGVNITDAADLREMYNRCIRAGKTAFMGYAAVDTNGFKIWEHEELWDAFQDIATAYPEEVKVTA